MKIKNIKHLINKIDHTEYVETKCYYRNCDEPSIVSHAIPKNALYKLNRDLTKILTFQTSLTPIINELNPNLMKSIDSSKFSTFKGFCKEHDNKLFRLIDQFDGVLTKEKICLVHYRNICYGIYHIKKQQKRLNLVASQRYIEDEARDQKYIKHFNPIIRDKLSTRLAYCLQEHILRKKQLEEMIKFGKFDQIEFLHLIGDIDNPIFCGRSSIVLNEKHKMFNYNGYGLMPWITYMTLVTNHRNYLVFCWLRKDKKLASHLKYLCKKKAPKDLIEILAYGYSDSLAIDVELYRKHSGAIEHIRENLGCY